MATVEPHAFLLQQIGGDRIRVDVLVPAGKEPESYQLTPDKMSRLMKSKAFFCTGMPFEAALLPKLQSVAPDLHCVDLREGLKLRKLELHSHAGEEVVGETEATEHEHGESCSHDGLDPHIWFAPSLLKTQADTVLNVLQEANPENAEFYRENRDRLVTSMETLRTWLAETLAPFRGRSVLVFHPSYGYFCDEFGLHQHAIEYEGKSPKPQQLALLIAETKKEPRPPVIFVQPEFNRSAAHAIAEATGGIIVTHSCLERDVLQSMKRFAEEFVRVQKE